MTKLNILHFSPHNEYCGIGKYQERFVFAMDSLPSKKVSNEFFEYSPYKTREMSHDEFGKVLVELENRINHYNILHIQYEFSFFRNDQLSRMIDTIHKKEKKVIITVHTAPDAQYKKPKRLGYGFRNMIGYFREIKAARYFTNVYIKPLKKADLILVHNTATSENLIKHGINKNIIKIIPHPVPDISFDNHSDEIKKALSYQKGDVLIACVGFISESKGVSDAIKSLSYLPNKYKLALIGGIHPSGGGEKYLDSVCDLIVQLNLEHRVYVTGYIEEDSRLNALIRECSVCVFPYDKKYYEYVSSGALNTAIANHKPAIVYPTRPFIEMNHHSTIAICSSANYYELARSIVKVDYEALVSASILYAEQYSYKNEAIKLVDVYKNVL